MPVLSRSTFVPASFFPSHSHSVWVLGTLLCRPIPLKPPDQGIFFLDACLVSFSGPPGLLPPQHPSRQQAGLSFENGSLITCHAERRLPWLTFPLL